MERIKFDTDDLIPEKFRRELVIDLARDPGPFRPLPVEAIPRSLITFGGLADLIGSDNQEAMKSWFKWYEIVQKTEAGNTARLLSLCETIVWAVKLMRNGDEECKKAFSALMGVLIGEYKTKHFPAEYAKRHSWAKHSTVNFIACPAQWRDWPVQLG